MQGILPDQTTELATLDNGFINKYSLLPAVALAVVGLLCYAVSLWLFKQKSIGGWAWVLPFLASSAVGVVLYRQQCLSVGVLTNTESVVLARNMSIWVAISIVVIYSFTQKSITDGFVALFLGGMMFAIILFTGFFVVKTMLLMQNEPDRERGDDMSVQEIEKMKADYRLQRGLHEVPDPQKPVRPQTMVMVMVPGAVSAPNALGIAVLPRSIYTPASAPVPVALSTQVSRPMPLALDRSASAAQPVPVVQPVRAAQAVPAQQSAPAVQPVRTAQAAPAASAASNASDEEIRLKIIEVRKQALRAQRRAEMQAKGAAPAPKSVPKA